MKIQRFTLLAALLTGPAFAQTGPLVVTSSVIDLVNNDTSGGASDSAGIKAWNSIRLYSTCCGYTSNTDYGIEFQPRDGSARFKGSVGIGTTTPEFKLDVQHDNYNAIRATGNSTNSVGLYVRNTVASGRQWALLSSGGGPAPVGSFAIWDDAAGARLTINTAGNVGIGTTSPQQKLAVNGYIDAQGFLPITNFLIRTNPNDTQTFQTQGSLGKWGFTNNDGGGNVGIGTSNPTHKLAVNGTIKAKEVIVETTGWSDYVFADDYRLAPLSEVEAHIKASKHLPGLPSAAQVAENGVSLGEVQSALLAKVEELTLHLIAQQKQLNAQQQAMQNLQRENAGLQSRLGQLEAR